MKHLHLKLGIFVIILFGLVSSGLLLYRPIKVRYYTSKLCSDDINVRQNAAKILLDLNRKSVFDYYAERYSSKDMEERIEVVNELCAVDKEIMREIFKNWACNPTQQVKIPAGIIKLEDGRKVEVGSFWVDKYQVTNEKYYTYLKCNSLLSVDLVFCENNISETFISSKNAVLISFDNKPAVNISWLHAKSYANWIDMRLPSRLEWEYAIRLHSLKGLWTSKFKDVGITVKPKTKDSIESKERRLYDLQIDTKEWCAESHFNEAIVLYVNDVESLIESKLVRKNEIHPNIGFRCVRDP